MKNRPSRRVSLALAMFCALAAAKCFADHNVTVIATANPAYTQHKYGRGRTAPETYVLRPGRFVGSGQVTCRVVAEALAPELAREKYLPAKDVMHADLGIVVQWGTGGEVTQGRLPAQLFLTEATVPGNRGQLLMDQQTIPSTPPQAAPFDMPVTYGSYFMTLEAYDLHAPVAERNQAVWTVKLSIPTVGNNLDSALKYLRAAAAEFAGRATEERQHVRPVLRAERIETGPVVILGEEN